MADRKDPDERFNPFRNEGDMFKIVLYVAAGCVALALLALLIRSVV